MPSAPEGVWVEYARTEPPVIIRPHSTKIRALEAAVDNINGAVLVRFGETLAEALERVAEERMPQRKVTVPTTTGKPATTPALAS